MWNFLKGLFRSGELFKKILYFILAVAAFFVALAVFIGVLSEIPFVLLFAPSLFNRIKGVFEGKFTDIHTVPYWGKIFGLKNVIKLLSGEKFKPYVMADGRKCKSLLVSSSGRWFTVAGRYYPIHLVRSYNRETNEVMMIDGTILPNQHWMDKPETEQALYELFRANRIFEANDYDYEIIRNSRSAFERLWYGEIEDLAKANWENFRFAWEKELAEIEANDERRNVYKKHLNRIAVPGVARQSMYERVLNKDEINAIVGAINDGRINNLDGWFDITRFKDDLCVRNGVNILMKLGYSKNAIGKEFLFDCIRNIQKPYFEPAILTLQAFPRQILIEEIEKYVKQAHDDSDVLFGAGLLYLAKKINYKISLQEKKNEKIDFEGQVFGGAMAQYEEDQEGK